MKLYGKFQSVIASEAWQSAQLSLRSRETAVAIRSLRIYGLLRHFIPRNELIVMSSRTKCGDPYFHPMKYEQNRDIYQYLA